MPRQLIKVIYSILIFGCTSATAMAQTGPYKILDFEIDKTTVYEIVKDWLPSSTPITNDDDFNEAMAYPHDSFFVSSNVYEIRPIYSNKMFAFKPLIFTIDSGRTFFINQLEVGEFDKYVINNIVLYFFNDTLTKITYDAPVKTGRILVDNYKGKAISKKQISELSRCKIKMRNGKRFNNSITTYSFGNDIPGTLATIALHTIADADCDLSVYYKVEIYSRHRYKSWFDSCKRYLVAKKEEVREAVEAEKRAVKSNF